MTLLLDRMAARHRMRLPVRAKCCDGCSNDGTPNDVPEQNARRARLLVAVAMVVLCSMSVRVCLLMLCLARGCTTAVTTAVTVTKSSWVCKRAEAPVNDFRDWHSL